MDAAYQTYGNEKSLSPCDSRSDSFVGFTKLMEIVLEKELGVQDGFCRGGRLANNIASH